jgi:hypothetical protein
MFDTSLIVQSAVSSFNNAAVYSPDFFWAAVMALPVFYIAWKMRREIAAKIPHKILSGLIIAILGIWTLSHGAFDALRDTSWVGVLSALCIFVITVFVAKRTHIKNQRWKWAAIAGAIAVGAFCGQHTVWGLAIGGGAVAAGIAFSLLLRDRDYNPSLVITCICIALGFGIAMQPEFFRWGQLGQLTIIHIAAALAFAKVSSAALAGFFAKPGKRLGDRFYAKLNLGLRVMESFSAVLFIYTESALVLGAFFAIAAATAWFAIRHSEKHDAGQIANLTVGAFGILTGIPALTCISIINWKKMHLRDCYNLL